MEPQGLHNEQQVQQPARAGSGGRRLEHITAAAKLAAAREKNRLAQQRFRERQRAKQQTEGVQCEELQQEMEQLELENEQLQWQARIYEKVLAVRDAMLHTLHLLQPSATEQQQQQQQQAEAAAAATAAAAQGFARALDDLPSEQELEDATPFAPAGSPAGKGDAQQAQQAQQAQDQAQQQRAAGQLPAQSVLGEAHRNGTAEGLDGSALEQVELIPPASNQRVRALITDMQRPEDLLLFVRQWQAELSLTYQAAEAAGFDAASVAEVERVLNKMTEMWWHVGQLRPAYLSYLAHATFPENSSQLPLWREIAAEVLPGLDESSRARMRRSWHTYSMRLAKAAVGVARWVRRLQAYTVCAHDALASHAGNLLELAEITSHIKNAVQDEYIASMEFVAAQFPVSTPLSQAYVNYRCAPYLPDLVAIVYQILLLDSQERQAAEQAA